MVRIPELIKILPAFYLFNKSSLILLIFTLFLWYRLYCVVFFRKSFRCASLCCYVKALVFTKAFESLSETHLQTRDLIEIASIHWEKHLIVQISIGRSTGLNGFRNSTNEFAFLPFFRNQRYSAEFSQSINNVSEEKDERTKDAKKRQKISQKSLSCDGKLSDLIEIYTRLFCYRKRKLSRVYILC